MQPQHQRKHSPACWNQYQVTPSQALLSVIDWVLTNLHSQDSIKLLEKHTQCGDLMWLLWEADERNGEPFVSLGCIKLGCEHMECGLASRWEKLLRLAKRNN